MSQQTIWKCDRCGADISLRTPERRYVAKVHRPGWDETLDGCFLKKDDWDLCPDCAKEVIEFIQKDCRPQEAKAVL